MQLVFQPMDVAAAREVVRWRYEPPYDIYNPPEGDDDAIVAFLTEPRNTYYRIDDAAGEVAAFCCFGEDGRVPGGDYHVSALDIGLGVRPALTGHGRGGEIVAAVCAFAEHSFAPTALRVTIAAWNARAQRVWHKAGFAPVERFAATHTGTLFVVLVRSVHST